MLRAARRLRDKLTILFELRQDRRIHHFLRKSDNLGEVTNYALQAT